MNQNKDIINSIDRALEILLLMCEKGHELGISEISNYLNIYKSTIHRTLVTLENRGFVQQNNATGKYGLGISAFRVGMSVKDNFSIKNLIHPFALELSKKYNEVINIGILDKTSELYPKHIIIEKLDSNKILSITPSYGSTGYSHVSSLGKVLLAYSPREYLDKYKNNKLLKFTKNSIVDWDDLFVELELIRERGYSIDNEELEIGLTCVAVPIFNGMNEIVAGLSISGPTVRMTPKRLEKMIIDLKSIMEKMPPLLD